MARKNNANTAHQKQSQSQRRLDDLFASEMEAVSTPKRDKTPSTRTPPSSGRGNKKIPRHTDQESVQTIMPSSPQPGLVADVHMGDSLSPKPPPSLTNTSIEGQTTQTIDLTTNDGSPTEDDTSTSKTTMSSGTPGRSSKSKISEINAHLYVYNFHKDGTSNKPKVPLEQKYVREQKAFTEYESEEPTDDDLHHWYTTKALPMFPIIFPDKDVLNLTMEDFDKFVQICNDAGRGQTFKGQPQLKSQAGEVRRLAYRLRCTTPEVFGPKLWNVETGTLISIPITLMWRSANNIYGSAWRLKTKPKPPPTPKPPSAPTP